ncbi:TPA: hypothetical protein ACSRWF_003411 [Morganella morganii]|uniref:hypothetical protein n=1 Tax=Morganella morganii TaxID=582 RepID=UPI001BD917B9|nr:hypothetical protein [Morganella morganii]MBT0387869.1 hypothetical protein [Morganella morganii subsp. morganii]HCR3195228.1 hypothetical protein [Morganella morganii]
MAGNVFDFELNASENVTAALANIEDDLNRLRPKAREMGNTLKLGGDETLTGLRSIGDQIRDMSDFAKNGTQHIGDMVPPLKMVGELAKKIALPASLGGMVYAGYEKITEEGKRGTEIKNQARDMGSTPEEVTRLSGVLQQRGKSEGDSNRIIKDLYVRLSNAAVEGQDNELNATFASLGAPIIRKKNGAVDVEATLLGLEKQLPRIDESRNHAVLAKLGLDEDLLRIMRNGELREYMFKSDKLYGRSSKDIDNLSNFDDKRIEARAIIDGLNTQLGNMFAAYFVGDPYDMMVEQHKKGEANQNALYHGNKKEDIRGMALRDKKFMSTLSAGELWDMQFGFPDEDLEKKLNEQFEKKWEAERDKALGQYGLNQKIEGIGAKVPDNWSMTAGKDPNVRAYRNNNPGNVRWASNEVGRDRPGVDANGNKKGFAQFRDEADGRAALARQLLLYMDRGNNTVGGILELFAPKKDRNNTEEYIRLLSKHMNVNPDTPLDLYDQNVLAQMMNGIIRQESDAQPYTYQEMMASIDDAVNSPRWAGLRHPDKLEAQRERWAAENSVPDMPAINHPAQPDTQQIVDALSKAIRESLAAGQESIPIEITFINPDTGARQTVNTKPKGRVTTAMNYP